MNSQSKQVGRALIHANGRESDLLGSGKKIAALWTAYTELSHQDRDMSLILLSVIRTLEAREKGAGAGPRLFDARRNSPG